MLRLALPLLALALAGCVHTTPLGLDSADGRSEINRRAAGRSADVKILGAPRHAVRNLHLAPDVTTWTDVRTGALRSVATDSVQSVTFLDRATGAAAGALGAALAGFAVGYETSSGGDLFPREWLGFLLGALAAPVGAAVGAEAGKGDVFRRVGGDAVGTAPGAAPVSRLSSVPDSLATPLSRRR